MFSHIAKLFKNAQNKNKGQALSQSNHPANASRKEANLEWKSLDITRLNITGNQLQNIEASMAEKSRAEFAAVTKALNASQGVKGSQKDLVKK
jgi:hypothetical protein